MTTSTLHQDAVSVGGRVIPAERLVGVAQITELFNQFRDQMTLPEGSPCTVKRSHVSNWANRRETTGFPAPLEIPAFGAYVWDVGDFIETHPDGGEFLVWTGPPGRWARRPAED